MKSRSPCIKVALAILIISICSGCNPVYRTFYTYTPPKEFAGKQCVNNCLSIKQQCEQTQSFEHQSCLNRAQIAHSNCLANQVFRYDSRERRNICMRNCFCSQPNCSRPDPYVCDERYNRCYTNCGGEVLPYQKCISNCDQEDF